MEFLTANDYGVPATSLNDELNVPTYVLQGHFGTERVTEDVWDMSDRTPAMAMKYWI